MFLASRFILGMGIPVAIVAASSLLGGKSICVHIIHCTNPSIQKSSDIQRSAVFLVLCLTLAGSLVRVRVISTRFKSHLFSGAIVAAGTTLGTFSMPNSWAWRIPSLLQVIPSLMQVGFVYFLPESPRWLVSKGRGDEALAILIKYHGEGDDNAELPKAEYVQIEKTPEMEKETNKVGWGALFVTPGMRKRALIAAFLGLATQWSGNGLTSWAQLSSLSKLSLILRYRYYLARILENVGVTNKRTVNEINLAYNCWGFLNATTLALTIPRFKRRNMYMVRGSSSVSIPALLNSVSIALYYLIVVDLHRLDSRQCSVRNYEQPCIVDCSHCVRSATNCGGRN